MVRHAQTRRVRVVMHDCLALGPLEVVSRLELRGPVILGARVNPAARTASAHAHSGALSGRTAGVTRARYITSASASRSSPAQVSAVTALDPFARRTQCTLMARGAV